LRGGFTENLFWSCKHSVLMMNERTVGDGRSIGVQAK
jgi:hypothetical protein